MTTQTVIGWQDAVYQLMLDRLVSPDLKVFRATVSPRTFNMSHGVRINAGRRAGHSTLARKILAELDAVVLVVPTNAEPPYSDKARHEAELRKTGHEDLANHIWVSRPLDIAPMRGGIELIKSDVLQKTFAPIQGKEICVVDAASRFSEDEIEVLRATPWAMYVELG